MRYYEVTGGHLPQYYNGEFPQPYPNLVDLFLGPDLPRELCIIVQEGKVPGDMLFSTPNVVSANFVNVLRSCHATGFQAFPVSLVRGTTILTYWGLKLIGRGGPFDPKRSEAKYTPDGGAIIGYNCIHMDETQWDGSDVFAIPGLGISMYVTERVKEAFERENLLNVRMVLNTDCYLGGPRLQAEIQKRREEMKRSRLS